MEEGSERRTEEGKRLGVDQTRPWGDQSTVVATRYAASPALAAKSGARKWIGVRGQAAGYLLCRHQNNAGPYAGLIYIDNLNPHTAHERATGTRARTIRVSADGLIRRDALRLVGAEGELGHVVQRQLVVEAREVGGREIGCDVIAAELGEARAHGVVEGRARLGRREGDKAGAEEDGAERRHGRLG